MASMPNANPMLVDLNEMKNVSKKLFELLEKNCKRESIFYTSKEELRLIDVFVEAKLILREWHVYFEVFQNRFNRDVKEMKDVFVSVENDLDETFKQNEFLKDQLLEASLPEDIKNLVITSCVKIRNKVLHDETERISKALKDVSNESTTADTICNDAFEVTQELSKRIHKSRENNSLKTLQKENENFMASLQIENAHLKQTYKDLFESVQRSRVKTNECDEVKVKSRVQTKTSNVTQNEAENLKSQLFEFAETKFTNILEKTEFLKKKQLDISEFNKGSRKNVCDNAKCEFQRKFFELEKVLTQQTKDFDDVMLELSNRKAKFEAYFEKLEKTKVVLERQLARKVDDSKAEKD
ncbi:hypothetical protein Tco_1013783 [Tanacetum coccineum]